MDGGRVDRPAGRDAFLGLLLFGGALLARWPLVFATPYGDEAVHFYMAKTLGFLDDSVVWAHSGERFDVLPFVLGRPMFAFAPFAGATQGFHGFRVLGAVYSSLLAPAAFGLLRRLEVARWLSTGAGLVIAVHPTFVVWGARIFPDSLMALFALLGIWAWIAGRPALGSLLVVLACWTKESAVAVALGLAGCAVASALAASHASGPGRLRSVLGDRSSRLAIAASVIGLVPLALGFAAFPRLPGWAMGGAFGPSWEQLWLFSWLSLAPFVAIKVRRAGPLAAAGVGLFAFYLAFHGVRGGSLQAWFAILPGAVGLLSAVVLLDGSVRSLAWPRLWAPPIGMLLAGALAVAVFGSATASAAFHPLAPAGAPGLAASVGFVQAENPEMDAVWDFQRSERPESVLEVDLMWFWVGFPAAGSASTKVAYPVLTPDAEVPVEQLAAQAEASDLVWMQDWNGTFERAFHATYADCEAFAAGAWTAFRAQACPGRGARLRAEFEGLASG